METIIGPHLLKSIASAAVTLIQCFQAVCQTTYIILDQLELVMASGVALQVGRSVHDVHEGGVESNQEKPPGQSLCPKWTQSYQT